MINVNNLYGFSKGIGSNYSLFLNKNKSYSLLLSDYLHIIPGKFEEKMDNSGDNSSSLLTVTLGINYNRNLETLSRSNV